MITTGLTEDLFEHAADVVVVGSGAAGCAAAAKAAAEGAEVLMLEWAETLGGTTALSGAGAWIPANSMMRAEGVEFRAPTEAALRTLAESPEAVTEHLAYEGFECRVIQYASGGLVIGGLLWKPVDTADKYLPLIVANRGGNSDFGPMAPWAASARAAPTKNGRAE